ncbi:hypothetical protein NLJ89_g8421 [Agrocybe chaxingu]|uniref:Interferon-induced GTP-binding protein Mx n=1 Tax=Agrocybe chaxingu TaxID=84603 RepID=A0A9W8MUI1_9AGAR|nr:hypothetical protein NLJ89_g8421 [Agrocybe chaxingu]
MFSLLTPNKRRKSNPPPRQGKTRRGATTNDDVVDMEFSDDEHLKADAPAGVGLADHKMTQEGRRRLLDLVNRLHSTGVQIDIDLPQIAVIGSQSTGKSSLIESISGITLPRSAGTCTRCPTECRLSKSTSPWQCIVSLRFTTDASGQNLGQARNEVFGNIIHNKSEVEERIRRAQRAILNPDRTLEDILREDANATYENQLSFSMNCVSLQISGPDVADLSFCDLPGLIASVSSNSRGGENDIALVKRLVTSYIQKPSCIILLTVSCETDFENQGAHHLAKQYDAEGRRTIGVLTKPDRIPTSEEDRWLPFIQNEKEPLVNNWFCVKQPSSNDLKNSITWLQARQREEEFFSNTAPWSSLDSEYQKYLGTMNLVQRLSLVLSDLSALRLPQIRYELQRAIANTKKALKALPREPPSNPQAEIISLITDFTNDLNRHVEGVPDVDGLIQAIRLEHEVFRKAIRRTAPNFRPFEKKYEHKRHLRRAVFLVEEEGGVWPGEDSEDELELERAAQYAPVTPLHQPSGQRISRHEPQSGRLQDTQDPFVSGGSRRRDGAQGGEQHLQPETSRGTKRKNPGAPTNKIYVDEVLERAYHARTRELPGNYPFIVQKTFIQAFVREWAEPSLDLCDAIHKKITQWAGQLVKRHFANFGQGELEQKVSFLMERLIEECTDGAKHSICEQLAIEEQPFTVDTRYLSSYRKKFMDHYAGERQRYDQTGLIAAISEAIRVEGRDSLGGFPQRGVSKIMAGLSELGVSGLDVEALHNLLPTDEMEPALGIMAGVRSYFQVAHRRFTDNIPGQIDRNLVRGVARDLQRKLNEQLGINGANGYLICQRLVQEGSQIADRRAELKRKLERLTVANRELMSMGA